MSVRDLSIKDSLQAPGTRWPLWPGWAWGPQLQEAGEPSPAASLSQHRDGGYA